MKYIITDVHGCLKTLEALISQLRLRIYDRVYFLGDYVDRGPDSKGVIDFILNKIPTSYMLLGNHERMMINAHYGEDVALWYMNGGATTLQSFKSDYVFADYIMLFKKAPKIMRVDGYYLVHAGIDTNEQNPAKSDDYYLLWDRNCFPIRNKIICGHTPKTLDEIEASLKTNKICLDGGCNYKLKKGYGNLVALELETMKLYVQPNID